MASRMLTAGVSALLIIYTFDRWKVHFSQQAHVHNCIKVMSFNGISRSVIYEVQPIISENWFLPQIKIFASHARTELPAMTGLHHSL